LAFGGRQLIKTPNNPSRVGGSGRGDVIAEVGGGGREGRPRPIVWSGKWNNKKVNNIKCIVAFGGRWSIILHTTTNQKWAGVVEERVEKRDERGGVAE
jgi:hypothetical protein